MNYQELLNYKPQVMALFKVHGVVNPRIFGSTITGKQHRDSDIDFLISWPVKHSLFDRVALKNKLESLLHTKVDLVSDERLHPLVREQVLSEAKPL
jgi:predicted nucleotidyltransferase